MNYISDLAVCEDDYLLGQIFYSLNEDCQWHRQWSASLVRMLLDDNVRNREIIQGWIKRWYPLADHAVHAFVSLLEDPTKQGWTAPPQYVSERPEGYYR